MHCSTFLRRIVLLVTLCLGSGLVTQATAQERSAGLVDNKQQGAYAGAEGAFGQLDEDFFVLLNFNFGLKMPVARAFCDRAGDNCKTQLALSLQVPLRLRLVDRDPQNEGTLRKEDWDESGDYLRVIRFVEYGYPNEALHFRLGELGGVVLGHGTVMNRYFNVLDVDHYQFGLHGNLNTLQGGAQIMLDHLIEPEVVAGRAYWRPWATFAPNSWMTRYAVGVALSVDVDTPTSFKRREIPGELEPGPFEVDDKKNLVVEKSTNTGVLTLDQEILLVDDELVDFTPFVDVNFHLSGGQGLHVGTLTNLRPSKKLSLYTRAELRVLGERYIPDYFGSIYEIERNTYFGFGAMGETKLVRLRNLRQGTLIGAYGEITLDLIDRMLLTVAFEEYQGPDNGGLLLRLQLPAAGPLRAAAMFRKVGFDKMADALDPENALVAAEARYHILPNLYLLGQLSRLWRLRPEEELTASSNPYRTVNTWFFGVGSAIGF